MKKVFATVVVIGIGAGCVYLWRKAHAEDEAEFTSMTDEEYDKIAEDWYKKK